MTSHPRVTVLMPVYNGEAHVSEALASIAAQTYADYEFVIVNDGSTDGTAAILDDHAARDERLRVIHRTENRGIVDTLNEGLAVARGQYIARQDADDFSFPTRLAKQVAFMDSHPDVGLVACGHRKVYDDREIDVQPPQTDGEIKWQLLFGTPFTHTSVMFRRELTSKLAPFYRYERHCEDYAAWLRVASVTKLATLPEVLVRYAVRGDALSQRFSEEQGDVAREISRQAVSQALGRDIDMRERDSLLRGWVRGSRDAPSTLDIAALIEALDCFRKSEGLSESDYREIRRRWLRRVFSAIAEQPLSKRLECARLLLQAAPRSTAQAWLTTRLDRAGVLGGLRRYFG